MIKKVSLRALNEYNTFMDTYETLKADDPDQRIKDAATEFFAIFANLNDFEKGKVAARKIGTITPTILAMTLGPKTLKLLQSYLPAAHLRN